MFAKPQEEHRWLEQLVGSWRAKQECRMPNEEPTFLESQMSCRMLGGLWLVAENVGSSEETGDWTCVMTLGYDPQQNA